MKVIIICLFPLMFAGCIRGSSMPQEPYDPCTVELNLCNYPITACSKRKHPVYLIDNDS